jgi:hypothetical protein
MTVRASWPAIGLSLLLSLSADGAAVAQGASKAAKPVAQAAPQAPPQQPPAAQRQGPQLPQAEVLLLMIRSALIGLDHANRTGNYSVLREMGGPTLQQHSSGQLSNAFATLRSNGVDLLPAAILTPQLLQNPSVSGEGVLQLVGYVPTQPRRIEFHIVYQVAGGQWRLAGLNVGLGQPPAAPTASADPKAAGDARPKVSAPAAKK